MKMWDVCYRRVTNASLWIQAETEEEARERFENMSEGEIRKLENVGDEYYENTSISEVNG